MHLSTSRSRPTIVAVLAVVAVLGATAGATLAARAPTPPAAPIITAKASTATVGDKLNLNVVIKTSGKVGLASATAVVHFASGDAAATMPKVVKLKNGASLSGSVLVPADEAVGTVTVEFTIRYAGSTYTRSVTALVAAAPILEVVVP